MAEVKKLPLPVLDIPVTFTFHGGRWSMNQHTTAPTDGREWCTLRVSVPEKFLSGVPIAELVSAE